MVVEAFAVAILALALLAVFAAITVFKHFISAIHANTFQAVEQEPFDIDDIPYEKLSVDDLQEITQRCLQELADRIRAQRTTS